MKKCFIKTVLLLILSMVLVNSSMVYAEGFYASVAPKIWFASWEADDVELDSSPMIGVNGAIGYGKFGGGMSLLYGSFDIGEDTAGRTDVDLFFTYKAIEPYLNLSIGAKLMNYDLYYAVYDIETSVNVYGLGFGVSGGIPIVSRLYGYYVLSYLPAMEMEYDDFDETEDLSSHNIEVGLSYGLTETIMLSGGFKYQKFDYDEGGDDTLTGVTTSVSFNF